MSNGGCCSGDHNPWRKEPICVHCNDFRIVSKTGAFRRLAGENDLTPCPYCGDPEARKQLIQQRYKALNPLSSVREDDLTDEEKQTVKDWRDRGFHMQDCLRWIEGRKYDPKKDATFLQEARKEFKRWRLLSGR